MRNERIQPLIRKFVLPALLGGFVLVALVPPAAMAQGRMSRGQCIRELRQYIRTHRLQPTRRTYTRAQRYCRRGDIKHAIGVVQGNKTAGKRMTEAQCTRTLRAFIRRSGLSPSRQVYGRAIAYCEKTADVRGAVKVLQAGSRPPSDRMSETQCVGELHQHMKVHGFQPTREIYSRARRHCARGDLRGALTVIEQGTS